MKLWLSILLVVWSSAICRGDESVDLAGKGMVALKQNNYNQAEDYFTRAIKLNTNYLGAYYYRALVYIGMKQSDKGIADLNQVLLLNTNYVDAYYFRGMSYMDKKEYDKSLLDFDRALLLKTNSEILLYRAYVYSSLTNYNASIGDYTRAVQLNRLNLRAYLGRARIYLLQGAYGLAMMDCNAALSINPYSASAFQLRGEAYKSESDFGDAIDDYNKCLLIDPQDSSVYYSRAVAYAGKGDFSNAMTDCSAYIATHTNDAEAYSDRAWYRTELGDYKGAIEDGQKTIALDANFFWGYNNQAWLMAVCPEAKFRDGKKAVEYAKKACELSDWKEAECVDTLAAAYAESGNYKEAVKWEKKALGGLTVDNLEEGTKALSLYEKGKPYRETLKKQR